LCFRENCLLVYGIRMLIRIMSDTYIRVHSPLTAFVSLHRFAIRWDIAMLRICTLSCRYRRLVVLKVAFQSKIESSLLSQPMHQLLKNMHWTKAVPTRTFASFLFSLLISRLGMVTISALVFFSIRRLRIKYWANFVSLCLFLWTKNLGQCFSATEICSSAPV